MHYLVIFMQIEWSNSVSYRDYRIVRFVRDDAETFKILPIAYDKEGNPAALISEEVVLHHQSVTDLLHAVTHMMAAFSKPVLSHALFEPAPHRDATTEAFDLLSDKNV